MFNADLALSVTMTAISTILSVFALPANLILYANVSYEADVTADLDWKSVFIALAVVISAIALGLFSSYRSKSVKLNLLANKVGAKISRVLPTDCTWSLTFFVPSTSPYSAIGRSETLQVLP